MQNDENAIEEPAIEEITEQKLGVVTECVKLNVRENPTIESDVLAVLDFGTEVMVYESESTEDFYKIATATSVEGYCMKQYIAI